MNVITTDTINKEGKTYKKFTLWNSGKDDWWFQYDTGQSYCKQQNSQDRRKMVQFQELYINIEIN